MSTKRKRDAEEAASAAAGGATAGLGLPPLLPLPLPLVSGLPLLPAVEASGGAGNSGADNVLATVAAALAPRHSSEDDSPPAGGAAAGSYKYLLKVQPQPPRYPFVNVFFPIQVFLVDQKETMKTGISARLQIDILYENGEPADQSILQIGADNIQPRIDATGQVEVHLAIKQVSLNHENRSFFLRFSSDEKTSAGPIMSVTTTLMTVVRHRLKVTTQPPAVWYKDEGGRDKAIAVNAVLVDENDQPVRNREVPLKVLLLYEGDTEVEVKNQSILKIANDSPPKIDRQGKVALRVRIEEVSKNHQKQSFVVKIGPDPGYNPGNCDISADISTAVTVRSKRNKRRKTGKEAEDEKAAATTTVARAGTSTGATATKPKTEATAAGGAASAGAAVKKVPGRTGPTVATPVTSTPTVATPTASLHHVHHSNPHTTSYHLRPGSAAHQLAMQQAAAMHHQPNALPLPPPSTPSGEHAIGVDSKELQWLASGAGGSFGAAVHGVISWSQFVVKSLQDMEWQQVGWLEVSDEQPHRPLHRCPACWAYKDNIRPGIHQSSCSLLMGLQSYKNVSSLLQDLIRHVNARTGHQPASELFNPMPSSPTSSSASSSSASSGAGGTAAGSGAAAPSGVSSIPPFPSYAGISVLPPDSALHHSVPLTTGVSVLASHLQSHSGGIGLNSAAAAAAAAAATAPPPLPGGSPTAGDVVPSLRPSYRVSLPGAGNSLGGVSMSLMSPSLATPTTSLSGLSVPLPLHSSSSIGHASSSVAAAIAAAAAASSGGDVAMGTSSSSASSSSSGSTSSAATSGNPLDMISAVAVDEKEKHTAARLERQKSANTLTAEAVHAMDAYYLNAASSTALEPGVKAEGSASSAAGTGSGAGASASVAVDPALSEENCVFAVLVIQTEYGFPTFNSSHMLSGFYSNENSSYLSFVALASLGDSVDSNKLRDIQSQYDTIRTAPPSAGAGSASAAVGPGTGGATPGVSGIAATVAASKPVNRLINRADTVTLEHLREQALLTHFQNQAQQATNFLS